MPPTYVPWFREPKRQGCLVKWSRNQGEGIGIFLGTREILRPAQPERRLEITLDILDSDSGRVLSVETWRVRPIGETL